jgi:hypothetical protein
LLFIVERYLPLSERWLNIFREEAWGHANSWSAFTDSGRSINEKNDALTGCFRPEGETHDTVNG